MINDRTAIAGIFTGHFLGIFTVVSVFLLQHFGYLQHFGPF